MAFADWQYSDLLETLLEAPVREDRTGTGTRGIFSYSMDFPLFDGEFPLLTTKKVWWKGVVAELLWFLSGSTDNNVLTEQGVHIWDEWADSAGQLGPIYSHQWRKWGASPEAIPQTKPKLRAGVDATYLGVANGTGKSSDPLGKTWEGMIARCYDPESPSFDRYGRRGVSVCDRWLEFKAFAEDARKLPGWDAKENSTEIRYVLDKDQLGSGFIYSPETCQWVTDAENSAIGQTRLYTLEKDGILYKFTNVSRFANEQGIDAKNLSALWTQDVGHRYGFKFVSIEDTRPGVDQIAELVEGLKTNPYSRRHIVSAWNVPEVPFMGLPPCHVMFQCYVDDQDRLSLQIYQRSADTFLGVPFNIASYALLTCMLAHVTGYKPGVLYWVGGDVHLYSNHVEQAKIQLDRDLSDREAPTLILNPAITDIFSFTAEDIRLEGYDPMPAIAAEVAV